MKRVDGLAELDGSYENAPANLGQAAVDDETQGRPATTSCAAKGQALTAWVVNFV